MMRLHKSICIVAAALLLLALWAPGRYRLTGRYSKRSHGNEPFAGSSVTHLQLDREGTGEMWMDEGLSRDFRVTISWSRVPDGIDIVVPAYGRENYSYFSSPGTHHFVTSPSRLTAVGKREEGVLHAYGVKHGLPEKRFVFKKDILQL